MHWTINYTLQAQPDETLKYVDLLFLKVHNPYLYFIFVGVLNLAVLRERGEKVKQ